MLLALSSRFHNYLFLSLLQIRMQGLQTSGPLIEFLDLLTNIHFHLVKSLSLFVFHPSSGYISTANKNSSSPSLYYFPFLAWIHNSLTHKKCLEEEIVCNHLEDLSEVFLVGFLVNFSNFYKLLSLEFYLTSCYGLSFGYSSMEGL